MSKGAGVNEGKKRGLWDNIHAKRKRGEAPAKKGDKDYPKTLNVEGAAWTKKAGKNKEGGLNEKGRKSYERENPGSDLKAPQPEGGSRKKSFCARMGGMKKKLTSSKTANDPDSRINKALRKWKCNEDEDKFTPHIMIDKKTGKKYKANTMDDHNKYQKMGYVHEAKVDMGKSPEGKEAARNKRKFGTSHNQAKTGALRRSLHKIRRGDKKIKGEKPYYGDSGYAAEGAILDIVRKGMGKHKDAIQKRKVAARKATPYAAMAQSYEPEGNMIPEEGYDRMRDDRLVKYGIGHDGSDRRSGSTPSRSSGTKSKGKTVLQKQAEKKYGKGVTALDIVKAKIKAKHGDGAIMDKKK